MTSSISFSCGAGGAFAWAMVASCQPSENETQEENKPLTSTRDKRSSYLAIRSDLSLSSARASYALSQRVLSVVDFCASSDDFAPVSSRLPSKEPIILEPSPPEVVGEVCSAVLGVTGDFCVFSDTFVPVPSCLPSKEPIILEPSPAEVVKCAVPCWE